MNSMKKRLHNSIFRVIKYPKPDASYKGIRERLLFPKHYTLIQTESKM